VGRISFHDRSMTGAVLSRSTSHLGSCRWCRRSEGSRHRGNRSPRPQSGSFTKRAVATRDSAGDLSEHAPWPDRLDKPLRVQFHEITRTAVLAGSIASRPPTTKRSFAFSKSSPAFCKRCAGLASGGAGDFARVYGSGMGWADDLLFLHRSPRLRIPGRLEASWQLGRAPVQRMSIVR